MSANFIFLKRRTPRLILSRRQIFSCVDFAEAVVGTVVVTVVGMVVGMVLGSGGGMGDPSIAVRGQKRVALQAVEKAKP